MRVICLPLAIGLSFASALSALSGQSAQSSGVDAANAVSILKELRTQERSASQAWEAKFMAFVAADTKARKAGTARPARPGGFSLAAFVPRYQAAAKRFAGSEDAIPFLVWIASCGGQWDRPAGWRAVETLTTSHAASPRIASIGKHLDSQLVGVVGRPRADRLIEKLRAENSSPAVRGWLQWVQHGKALAEQGTKTEAYRKARSVLLGVAAETKVNALRDRIRKLVAKRERPSIGELVPDTSGVDLDGNRFKLSDYAGRVVLLDFWGDW